MILIKDDGETGILDINMNSSNHFQQTFSFKRLNSTTMPKITKEETNKSEDFWLWNQTNEDATADLNWSGEDIEQNDKK